MLPYERRVVDALLSTDDPERRRRVREHVAAELAAKPEVLRAGLVGETVLLSAWSTARRRGRPLRPAEELAWLEGHPVGLVRQWARALRSLVLFAEHELFAPGPSVEPESVGPEPSELDPSEPGPSVEPELSVGHP